jgi:hypothetical protein
VKCALPQPHQQEFEQAMTTLARAVVLPPKDGNPIASLIAMSADPGAAGRQLRSSLHGMTGSEVIAAGAKAAAALNEDRIKATESSVIATLQSIFSAQAQCQTSGTIDANGNGAGEYGFFAELAGCIPVHGGTQRLSPPVLSSAFGKITDSRITRAGYMFQMFLPDAKASGVIEAPLGGSDGVAVDPAQSEVLWCCYAWPTECGKSGTRAFFVNQSGDVLACSNTSTRYSGWDKAPVFTAAYQRGTTTMADPVAANAAGNDGETWLVVE